MGKLCITLEQHEYERVLIQSRYDVKQILAPRPDLRRHPAHRGILHQYTIRIDCTASIHHDVVLFMKGWRFAKITYPGRFFLVHSQYRSTKAERDDPSSRFEKICFRGTPTVGNKWEVPDHYASEIIERFRHGPFSPSATQCCINSHSMLSRLAMCARVYA